MDIVIEPGDEVEELTDLMLPIGAVWLPDPQGFCKKRGYDALIYSENGLFGLNEASRWESVDRDTKLKAV